MIGYAEPVGGLLTSGSAPGVAGLSDDGVQPCGNGAARAGLEVLGELRGRAAARCAGGGRGEIGGLGDRAAEGGVPGRAAGTLDEGAALLESGSAPDDGAGVGVESFGGRGAVHFDGGLGVEDERRVREFGRSGLGDGDGTGGGDVERAASFEVVYRGYVGDRFDGLSCGYADES